MAYRIVKIDEVTRNDHSFLTEDDVCYFFGDYTARRGYAFSETNGLISNLKKKPDRKGRPEWAHKEAAMARVSRLFKNSIKAEYLPTFTFVPMPCSKTSDHPDFDDRMHDILKLMGEGIDVRNILSIKNSVEASHTCVIRPSPDELYELMQIDPSLKIPTPTKIVICDDVLTTGAHFLAAKRHLAETFPNVYIMGLFVARRVPEAIDWDDIGEV